MRQLLCEASGDQLVRPNPATACITHATLPSCCQNLLPTQQPLRAGVQATLMFQQTMAFFKPMYRQLKHGTMVPEMKAGLWMILQNIMDRNYLAGYDIFMRLAIGAPPELAIAQDQPLTRTSTSSAPVHAQRLPTALLHAHLVAGVRE